MILSLFHLLVSGSLQTQTSVGMVEFASERLDAVATVLGIGSRFRYVERSLLRRHGGRSTIKITDEYDAQDLFRALLKIFFDDVRDEVWTPSYAGKSSRVDFVLPDFKLAVELKSTRATLNAASVGDQLIVDRDRYAKETSTNHLMCLVFDYDGNLENPRGMERDLERDATQEGLAVTVRIYDR
jgi:REase_DpnII-MboI